MSEIGPTIKRYRDAKKLTQSQLAQKVGESQPTVVGWEKGRTKPSIDQIRKLSDALDVSVSALMKSSNIQTKGSMSETPYFPDVNASAGLNFLADQSQHYSIPISIPNVKADAFINVFGDSMYPKYCSGEIIGIKEIENDMVMFGHAYVIQMRDGEAYLKYIKRGKDEDHWLLANENEKYEPREFHLSKIDRVFIIKAIISKTTLL